MAFKMNRPTIKGTKLHKESVAKAKEESVVRPYSSHSADVLSGVGTYSRSNVPHAIDYSLEMPDIDLKKKKKKKKKKGDKVVGCMDSKAKNYNSDATEPCDDCCKFEEDKKKEDKKNKKSENKKSENKNIKVDKDDSDESEQEYYNRMLDEEAESGSSGKVSDYGESKQYKNFVKRQEEESIKQAEELKRREAEASKARQSKVSTLETKKLEQTPSELSEPKLQTASLDPTKQRLYADQNPKYKIKQGTRDIEGNITSLGGATQSPNYNYDATNDIWTYNGIPIRESEVAPVEYKAIMANVMKDTAKTQTQAALQQPTASNTLIAETTPENINETSGDWKVDARVRRLDRLWAKSKEGGTVRKNMRKDGYTPANER